MLTNEQKAGKMKWKELKNLKKNWQRFAELMKATAPDVRRKQNAMSIIRYLHKIAEMLRPGESTVERSPGADDGRPERENMKNLIGNNLKRLFIFILHILPIQPFLCVRAIFILCVKKTCICVPCVRYSCILNNMRVLCVNQSIMRSCPLLSSSYKLRLLSIFNAIFFFL